MKVVTAEELSLLQRKAGCVRNLCILAHVDHGKTTLADALVAHNGIISSRMAGKLRYMDSRKDEQERGITMKSSAIAIYHHFNKQHYLVNLIDSPGHVDFSGEVWTGLQLCDGALLMVDVVEGVCPQTRSALRQAWSAHVKPILVMNKIDRLFIEKQLTPLDAYIQLVQLLEQLNALMADLFTTDLVQKDEEKQSRTRKDSSSAYEWSSVLDEADDSSGVYFSPESGNVVFTCALDGWGFRIADFAKIFSEKLGVKEEILQKTLWGDFYLNNKTKRILPGAQNKAKKPMFVQFILENIWSVYDAIMVCKDKERLEKITKTLGVKLQARDARSTDKRVQLSAVLSQWLPLSSCLLNAICDHLPSPLELTDEKVQSLMCLKSHRFDTLPDETQKLKEAFLKCATDADAPLIVFISKMFAVDSKILPQNKTKALTQEELSIRREEARVRHAAQQSKKDSEDVTPLTVEDINQLAKPVEETKCEDKDEFIAFARVYSGCLKPGKEVYVLGPKHDPMPALQHQKDGRVIELNRTVKNLEGGQYITRTTIDRLYLLMGREVEELSEVPAGSILGIGGLEEHVLKSATLSSTIACPAFTELVSHTPPILRVAIEPTTMSDMPALLQGLKLLNQADPCVHVFLQETGEHVIATQGEVHLQRCLDDLRNQFAKIDINPSEPIVPFRETVIIPPKVDMVNEAIEEENVIVRKVREDGSTADPLGYIEVYTPNKQAFIKMRAKPLPEAVTTILEKQSELLKVIHGETHTENPETHKSKITEETWKEIKLLKDELDTAFSDAGDEWKGISDDIWSFGPRRCGPNLLINNVSGYKRPNMWARESCVVSSAAWEYDTSFISGFQLATLSGPIAEEPMMGVCFIVESFTVESAVATDESISVPFGPFSGQIMSCVSNSCRRSFSAQHVRLMTAMFSCAISVPADALGRLYAVLGRRFGRVTAGDLREGSNTFDVTAVLPVIESFKVAEEMRRETSGLASPQLIFSDWETVDVDPWWEPSTAEELAHYGDKADATNRALTYMNNIRRRKGLKVRELIVEKAEKQRTLTKNV